MKYQLTFIIGHCCLLQSSTFPSLCNEATNAKSNAATDVSKLHLGQSATARVFQ
jgi:hypothetical protein